MYIHVHVHALALYITIVNTTIKGNLELFLTCTGVGVAHCTVWGVVPRLGHGAVWGAIASVGVRVWGGEVVVGHVVRYHGTVTHAIRCTQEPRLLVHGLWEYNTAINTATN